MIRIIRPTIRFPIKKRHEIKTIVLTVALGVVGVPVGFAQDAFMGVWKLKEAKSEFSPGAPKNSTVVYEVEGDKVKVTVDSISSDGKPTHYQWTGKFDGKRISSQR
jgi:hypothetical protein